MRISRAVARWTRSPGPSGSGPASDGGDAPLRGGGEGGEGGGGGEGGEGAGPGPPRSRSALSGIIGHAAKQPPLSIDQGRHGFAQRQIEGVHLSTLSIYHDRSIYRSLSTRAAAQRCLHPPATAQDSPPFIVLTVSPF